jgi:hypothetical protein
LVVHPAMRQLLHDAITATLDPSRVIVENLSQNDQVIGEVVRCSDCG